MLYSDGNQYQGDWDNYKPHGNGKMAYKNGEFYQGQWIIGLREGQGIYKHANGTKIEGEFCDDKPKETCTLTRSDGKTKQVDFKQEKDFKDYRIKVMVCRWVKQSQD